MPPHALPSYLRPLARIDKLMFALSVLLLVSGCFFLYGAGRQVGGDFAGFWLRQLFWAFLGFGCFVVLCCLDYRLLGRWSWVLYATGIVLLLATRLFGVTLNNARSWLAVPGMSTLRIQPAEMAKPATVLLAAWVASRPVLRPWPTLAAIPVLCVAAVPVVFILLQPDWGTALVFVPFTLAIVFTAGLPWKWIAAGALALAIVVPVAFPRLRTHQKNRIKVFLEQPCDLGLAVAGPVLTDAAEARLRQRAAAFFTRSGKSLDTDWNAHQSLLAVGSGGMWGKGYMKGTQHVLGFLPRTVAPTDFVFSVIAEETGFVGAAGLVCAFGAFIVCCLRTAATASDRLGALLATGVATIFFTHIYVNLGMTIRAAPIIGIPLPFVSYGGSFMISTWICAGLVQSVHAHRAAGDPDPATGEGQRLAF